MFFFDFVFSILAFCLQESSKFRLGEFAEDAKKRSKEKALWYDKRKEKISRFLESRDKRYLPFMAAAYILDAVFVFMLTVMVSPEKGTLSWGNITTVLVVYVLTIYLFARMFAINLAERWAEEIVFNNYILIRLTSLVLWPVGIAAGPLFRILERAVSFGKGEEDSSAEVEDDIKETITEGVEDGVLEEDEKKMIESVLEFDDSDVLEIMSPRTDIVAVSSTASLDEVVQTAIDSGYSRIPVYEGSIDNIIGILYVKDLLKYSLKENREKIRIGDIIRPAYFIPESKMVSELFEEIREKKNHFAVVLDEYGGTSGIVTAEDIIEEIVGEIEDEFDASEEDKIIWNGENTARVDARIDIGELNREMEISIPDEGNYESLGGFLASEMGKIPQSKETLDYENLTFKVLSGTKRKLLWVEVTKDPESDSND